MSSTSFSLTDALRKEGLSEADHREIVRRLVAAGRSAEFEPTLDRVVARLETGPRPGDVVVVTGAGDIERVCHEFTGRIRRNHAS